MFLDLYSMSKSSLLILSSLSEAIRVYCIQHFWNWWSLTKKMYWRPSRGLTHTNPGCFDDYCHQRSYLCFKIALWHHAGTRCISVENFWNVQPINRYKHLKIWLINSMNLLDRLQNLQPNLSILVFSLCNFVLIIKQQWDIYLKNFNVLLAHLMYITNDKSQTPRKYRPILFTHFGRNNSLYRRPMYIHNHFWAV